MQQKKKEHEANLKCTPIVVTGKKIISLKSVKGKASDEDEKPKEKLNDDQKPKDGATLPEDSVDSNNSKKLTDTKNMVPALLKPVPASIRPFMDDIDEELERKLLEEESTTPPPPAPAPNSNVSLVKASSRRVIIKPKDPDGYKSIEPLREKEEESSTTSRGKRVFERLERKGSSVASESKRKIQRIVVSNLD